MTKAITTEQLEARATALGLDFFIEDRSGIPVKQWFGSAQGCIPATDAEVAMWDLLAAREAVPVVWRYRTTDINGNPNPHWSFSEEASLLGLYQPLYTAPPAPAVPEIFSALIEHLSNAHAFVENTEAFGHTAANGIIQCGDAVWNIDESKEALNACRAALLAAAPAVPPGYKLAPNEPTDVKS